MKVVLLGPQRHDPNLNAAVRTLELQGRLATVTAGWQEREADDAELCDHLGHQCVNLELYRRAGEVFRRDPELDAAHQARQERLHRMQDLYLIRLNHAADACHTLAASDAPDALKSQEMSGAVEALRALDAFHLRRVGEVHSEFVERFRPLEREGVAAQRAELASIFRDVAALAVAGGHVAVLLNRLRLFGIAELLDDRPVIAWSAGAMAVSERVVLFHDDPPHGPGHPEVVENGLGLIPRVVALPHARYRLHLDDPGRVSLMARRFAPAACVPMDGGARLDWNGTGLWAPPGNFLMEESGSIRELAGSAS